MKIILKHLKQVGLAGFMLYGMAALQLLAQPATSAIANASSNNDNSILVSQLTSMLEKLRNTLVQNAEINQLLGGDLKDAKISATRFGSKGFDVRFTIKHGVNMAKVDDSGKPNQAAYALESFPNGSYEFNVFATNYPNQDNANGGYHLSSIMPHLEVAYYLRAGTDDMKQEALRKVIDLALKPVVAAFLINTGMKNEDVAAVYPELFTDVDIHIISDLDMVRQDPNRVTHNDPIVMQEEAKAVLRLHPELYHSTPFNTPRPPLISPATGEPVHARGGTQAMSVSPSPAVAPPAATPISSSVDSGSPPPQGVP